MMTPMQPLPPLPPNPSKEDIERHEQARAERDEIVKSQEATMIVLGAILGVVVLVACGFTAILVGRPFLLGPASAILAVASLTLAIEEVKKRL